MKKTLKEKILIFWDGIFALLMPVIILGGILGGIFTPTEASAVAVVYGFIVSFFVYGELRIKDLPKVFLESCKLTGVVMLVLGMASAFSFLLAFERIPHTIADYIEISNNWIVFVIIVHILFSLGMLMDALPALIILMPILVPAGVALGMNPIHLGILIEQCGVIDVYTSVGVCLYVACGLSKVPIEEVVKPLIAFFGVLLTTMLIISFVPEITLFFPRLLGYVPN